ncbi:MAG: thiamine pyrophosphate-binding protein [Candidatus Hydrogenedentota bacterium]|nr:MAG: thiamine pyrophosphate-binding protein [Candidatus Hydrogenedentota bacterium]GIX44323.1 MAG: indolepyruvate oxidoreductase subunit IorA [Candidatus Sumerlaea sp.]
MAQPDRLLLFGNEAVAHAARNAGVALGTGYPGTPSTEILETFSDLGGRAQWAPNEKVALEVALGASFCGARTLVTMKHVGVNVAADPLFTAAYTGVEGALVLVSADDPGMHSSQNEQDNRYYAVAAGIPMLEPADAQEAYDFTNSAIEISEKWKIPVMLRMTTRVCHSKSVVRPRWLFPPLDPPRYQRNIRERVMIPAYARPAHRRLRAKLAEIEAYSNACACHREYEGSTELGIVTSGVTFLHVREAAPDASILKLGCTHPVPIERIRKFAAKVKRCVVIEEGEPYLATFLRAAGIAVEAKPDMYRFGELNVDRVRRILAGDTSPEPSLPPGKLPELCKGCPYRPVYDILHRLDCIVAGDIGCYTLGVLPPYEAMDTCVCMGASITVGLGMRHVLPPDQARRVVSVIGDSTFVHTGLPGIAEMVYNPPPTGHVVVVLDNGTTAMTGQQEHPGTGRTLDHKPTNQVKIEEVARALGVSRVHVADPTRDPQAFEKLLVDCLNSNELCFVVARHYCILAAPSIREFERRAKQEFDYQCVPGGVEKDGE